jgi:hypothetical protein
MGIYKTRGKMAFAGVRVSRCGKAANAQWRALEDSAGCRKTSTKVVIPIRQPTEKNLALQAMDLLDSSLRSKRQAGILSPPFPG